MEYQTNCFSPIEIQVAINLVESDDVAAIANYLAYLTDKLQREAFLQGADQDYINQHPLVRILTISLFYLAYGLNDRRKFPMPHDKFAHALREAYTLLKNSQGDNIASTTVAP